MKVNDITKGFYWYYKTGKILFPVSGHKHKLSKLESVSPLPAIIYNSIEEEKLLSVACNSLG